MNTKLFGVDSSSLHNNYYKSLANGQLEHDALRLFIESVKQGEICLARNILSYVNTEQEDPMYLLYKGRYFSQIDKVDLFAAFFHKYEKILEDSSSLHEGILPWIWRMGINKAKKFDMKESEYYFDMHKEIAIISKHEMAHYFQCFGAVLIISGNIKKGNEYLSEALNIYFREFDRKEAHYSIVDNIRCIIMNLLLQGVMDIQVDDWDIAFKKFTFCQLWFLKTGLTMHASGISELVTLIKCKYPYIIKYVFDKCLYTGTNYEIQCAISQIYEDYREMSVYDIHFILRACIELNKPVKKIKYIYLEGLKMQSKKIFVVEGRNKEINKSMFTFLTAIGLEPMEWEQARALTNMGTPYIGEILDKAFLHAQAIIVLLTPDEECKLIDDLQVETNDDSVRYQPRPNVIFEAGAALAHSPDRTILVTFGNVALWSDIDGRHVIHMDNSPQKRQVLITRLKTAGCEIDIEGKTQWYDQGDFDL